MSDAETLLAFQLKAVGIPYAREVAFAGALKRRWRADFVVTGEMTDREPLGRMLLIEIDGGTWASSRHTTGAGFEADCVKLGEAVVLGYRVIRVTPKMVEDGRALALIERCLA